MKLASRINSIASEFSKLNPVTNIFGLARSLLALSTLSILIFNSPETLFFNLPNSGTSSSLLRNLSFFHLFGERNLNLASYISIAIMLLVISGWRPRITGFFHWWIAYSLYVSCSIIDGGDQINAILTLFLIPVCLCDNRIWHWSENSNITNAFANLFSWSIFQIIRIQIAFIYFNSAVAKFSVVQWIDGTDTYYWFTHPIHGAAAWIRPLIYEMMSTPVIVVFFTWGTIIFELLLSANLFMSRGYYRWRFFLYGGIIFHFGIVVVHGLFSFFLVMTSALVLFLCPLHYKIKFGAFDKLFSLNQYGL